MFKAIVLVRTKNDTRNNFAGTISAASTTGTAQNFAVHHPPWRSSEMISPQPLNGLQSFFLQSISIVSRQIKIY